MKQNKIFFENLSIKCFFFDNHFDSSPSLFLNMGFMDDLLIIQDNIRLLMQGGISHTQKIVVGSFSEKDLLRWKDIQNQNDIKYEETSKKLKRMINSEKQATTDHIFKFDCGINAPLFVDEKWHVKRYITSSDEEIIVTLLKLDILWNDTTKLVTSNMEFRVQKMLPHGLLVNVY